MARTNELEAPHAPNVSTAVVTGAATRQTGASTWFSAEDVARYQESNDENELSRAISNVDPTASRAEILFRYKLSKNVYLKEFNLPMLPASAVQVMQLGQDPNSSAADYLKVIQTDPSLASAIVKTSNSVLFARSLLLSGSKSDDFSLDDAIVRLGVNEIEKLALLHSFNAKLFRIPGHGELVQSVIQHGVAVSFAAQAVADETEINPTEAFLAGLFHDVGKLVLLQTISEVQQKLKWIAPTELVDSSFDAFHTVVGGLLCDAWELPEVITNAVRAHHSPEAAAQETIAQAVYLGNRMAHAIQESLPGDAPPSQTSTEDPDVLDEQEQLDHPVIEASGITKERLAALSGEVCAKLATLQGAQPS